MRFFIILTGLLAFLAFPGQGLAQDGGGQTENLRPSSGAGSYGRLRALARIEQIIDERGSTPELAAHRQRFIERGGYPDDFNPQTGTFADGRTLKEMFPEHARKPDKAGDADKGKNKN